MPTHLVVVAVLAWLGMVGTAAGEVPAVADVDAVAIADPDAPPADLPVERLQGPRRLGIAAPAMPAPAAGWLRPSPPATPAAPPAASATTSAPPSGLLIIAGFVAILGLALAGAWRWLAASQQAARSKRGLVIRTDTVTGTVCLVHADRLPSTRLVARDRDRERAVAAAAAALAAQEVASGEDAEAGRSQAAVSDRIRVKYQSTRRVSKQVAAAIIAQTGETGDG